MRKFDRCVAEIRKHVELTFIVQAFSSGGIAFGLKSEETNAVCPGQLLFGIEQANLTAAVQTRSLGSRPVLQEVRTVVGALHRIPPGTRFGFGGAFVTSRESRLGVLPVGFSNSILVSRGRTDCKCLGPRCADLDGGIGTRCCGRDRNSRSARRVFGYSCWLETRPWN